MAQRDTKDYFAARGVTAPRRSELLTARRLLAFAIIDRDRGLCTRAAQQLRAAKLTITRGNETSQ